MSGENFNIDKWQQAYNKTQKEIDQVRAKSELINMQAMLILIQDEDLGAEVGVGGLRCGVSVNERLRSIIEQEIKEVELFLAGEPNNWE